VRWTALLGVACVVLAACSSPGHGQPLTTVPTASTTTTTPLSQVPAVIDLAYVQRVMDVLDHLTGEAAREFVAQKGPTPKFEQIIEAVYTKSALDDVKSFFGRAAAQTDLSPLRPDPHDPTTSVLRIVVATGNCVVFEAKDDLGPILVKPPDPGTADSIFQLVAKNVTPDPLKMNPTPWVVDLSGQKGATTLGDKPCG